MSEVLTKYKPDRIIIEPSGVGKLSDVMKAVIDVSADMDVALNSAVTIVDAANGHDVTDSIINGKIVMKNREVLTLDEERIRFEAEKHMNDIIKRAY